MGTSFSVGCGLAYAKFIFLFKSDNPLVWNAYFLNRLWPHKLPVKSCALRHLWPTPGQTCSDRHFENYLVSSRLRKTPTFGKYVKKPYGKRTFLRAGCAEQVSSLKKKMRFMRVKRLSISSFRKKGMAWHAMGTSFSVGCGLAYAKLIFFQKWYPSRLKHLLFEPAVAAQTPCQILCCEPPLANTRPDLFISAFWKLFGIVLPT